MLNDDEIFAKNTIQLDRAMNNWNVRNDLKNLDLDIIRSNQPKLGYSIGLVNIDGGLNVGTIIRTAVIFGADKVYIIGRKRYDRRSLVGAQNYIDIDFIPGDINSDAGAANIINVISGEGYTPVIIEQSDKSKNISAYSNMKCCYMFGAEGEGMPTNILNACNNHVEIAQYGVMRSLNVSAAAAIIMHCVSNTLNK